MPIDPNALPFSLSHAQQPVQEPILPSSLQKREDAYQDREQRKQALEQHQNSLPALIAQHSLLTKDNPFKKPVSVDAMRSICLSFQRGNPDEAQPPLSSSIVPLLEEANRCITDGQGIFMEAGEALPKDTFQFLPHSSLLGDRDSLLLEKITDLGNKHRDAVMKLKPGQHHVVYTPPGPLYRFERAHDGTFDIYLYTASESIQSVQSYAYRHWRKKVPPYIHFSRIQPEELTFSKVEGGGLLQADNALFTNMCATYHLPDAAARFVNCLGHLAGPDRRVIPDHASQLFTSLQQTKWSGAKTLNCYVMHRYWQHTGKNDAETLRRCKLFSFEMRLRAIMQAPRSLDSHKLPLKAAAQNFLRRLNNYYCRENSIITETAYQHACATVCDLLQQLEADNAPLSNSQPIGGFEPLVEKSAEKMREAQEKNTFLLAPHFADAPHIRPLDAPPHLGEMAVQAFNDGHRSLQDKLSTLHKTLTDLATWVEAGKDQPHDVALAIDAAMRTLSPIKTQLLEAIQWQGVGMNMQTITSILETLFQLQAAYTKSNPPLSVALENTSMEFLGLSYALAVAADRAAGYSLLEKYKLGKGPIPHISSLFAIQDPLSLAQRHELVQFFASHQIFASHQNVQEGLFDFNTRTFKDFSTGKHATDQLYQAYLQQGVIFPDRNPACFHEEVKIDSSQPGKAFCHMMGVAPRDADPLPYLTLLKKSILLAKDMRGIGTQNERISPKMEIRCYQDGMQRVRMDVISYRRYWSTDPTHHSSKKDPFHSEKFSYQGEDFKSISDQSQNTSLNTYLSDPRYCSFDQKHLITENELRQQGALDPHIANDKLYPYLLALTQPAIQTSALLETVARRLDDLQDADLSRFLTYAFLKPMVSPNGSITSSFIDTAKNETGPQQFEQLIEAALLRFIEQAPPHRPRIDEMLWVIRLYARALQVRKEATCGYSLQTQAWVNRLSALLSHFSHLSQDDSQRREIALCTVGLLGATPLEQLTHEQAVSLFVSAYKVRGFPRTAVSDYHFQQESLRCLFESLPEWNTRLQPYAQEEKNRFAHEILQMLYPSAASGDWNIQANTGRLIRADGKVHLGLWDQTIYTEEGMLSSVIEELPQSLVSSRLLNNRRPPELHQMGDFLHWHDPIWGEMRVLKERNYALIQRRGENGKWEGYLDPALKAHKEHLDLLPIGSTLKQGHAIWFTEKQDPIPPRYHICNLQSGKLICHSIPSGIIAHADQHHVLFPLSSHLNERENWGNTGERFFGRLESSSYLQAWCLNGVATPTRLDFPRFCSETGDPLSFHWDEQHAKWQYGRDRQFAASNRNSLLTHPFFERSLLLQSTSGKERLLVPHGSVEYPIYIYGQCQIDLPDSRESDAFHHSIRFFEYAISDGRLVGHSVESKIYLATLYLAQKDYQLAFETLQSLSPSERLSPYARELATTLLNPRTTQDMSPNAWSVRLHALLIFSDMVSSSIALGDLNTLMMGYEDHYFGFIQNIEAPLRLHFSDEMALLDLFERLLTSKAPPESLSQILQERQKFLTDATRGEVVLSSQLNSPEPFDFSTVKPDKALKLQQLGWDRYQQSVFSLTDPPINQDVAYPLTFLGTWADFKTWYQELSKSQLPLSPQVKGMLYTLLTARYASLPIHQSRVQVLLLVFHLKLKGIDIPNIPPFGDRGGCKIPDDVWKWGNQLIEKSKEAGIIEGQYGENLAAAFVGVIGGEENKAPFSVLLHHPSQQEGAPSHIYNKGLPREARHAMDPKDAELVWVGHDAELTGFQKDMLLPDQHREIAPEAPIALSEEDIAKEDPLYQASIKNAFNTYQKTCQEARQRQAEERSLSFDADSNLDIDRHLQRINTAHQAAVERETDLKRLIERLAQYAPQEQWFQHQAAARGGALPNYQLNELLALVVEEDALKRLRNYNPYLPEKELEHLYSACIELMLETTHRQHLERLAKPLSLLKERKGDPAVALEEFRMALCEEREYIPTIQVRSLFFEYLSGLRVRKRQAAILNEIMETIHESDPEVQGIAFQAIMGGGKTSVIISYLLKLLEPKKELTVVLCHSSQFTAMKGNLTKWHKERFNRKVYALDYTFEELSKPDTLAHIWSVFQKAKRTGAPVIMRTSFSQMLEDFFISRADQLANKPELSAEEEAELEIHRSIAASLNSATAILDETDSNLDIRLEVTIPVGKRLPVPPTRSGLMHEIYRLLVTHHDNELQLTTDKQGYCSKERLNRIFQETATHLFEYSPLMLMSGEGVTKEAFVRFVCGQMQPRDQEHADNYAAGQLQLDQLQMQEERDNCLFLNYLQEKLLKGGKDAKEAGELICLANELFRITLPYTLSKSNKQDYCWESAHDNGQVAPCTQGEESPNKVANMYVEQAYHLQLALSQQLSEGSLRFLEKKMIEAATYYSQLEHCSYQDTLEGKLFKDLTKVELGSLSDPEHMKQAYAYVNARPKRRIDVQLELINQHVTYQAETITSNAINTVSQYKKVITGSGTMWNASTLHKGIKLAYEEGTEGSVINCMADRALANELYGDLHCLDHPERIKELFASVKQKRGDLSLFRGLIDTGGFYKDQDNVKTASELLEQLNEEVPEIKGVLYLHKPSKEEAGQGIKEQFRILFKDGVQQPLQTTTEEEIGRYIKKEELFVFFDQKRTTGTDIKMHPNALLLETVSHHSLMRDTLQGTMRGRQLAIGQRVETITSTAGAANMIGGGKTLLDIFKTLIRNESIALKGQEDSSDFAEIDNVFRSCAWNHIKKATTAKEYLARHTHYRSFLVKQQSDSPAARCARIPQLKDKGEVLDIYAEAKLQAFKECALEEDVIVEATQTWKGLRETLLAKREGHLLLSSSTHHAPALDGQVEQQVQQEQQQEVQQEQQQEVQLIIPSKKPDKQVVRVAHKWELDPAKPLWEQIQVARPLSIDNALIEGGANRDYAQCFSRSFYLSQDFYYTANDVYPFFHPIQKQAECLLLVKQSPRQYATLLLSKPEVDFFKEWLSQYHQDQAVLLRLNDIKEEGGREIIQDDLFNRAREEAIFDANLFNGEGQFLEIPTQFEKSKKVIKNRAEEKGLSEETLKQSMADFLLNRTQNQLAPLRRRLPLKSQLFPKFRAINNPKDIPLFSKRRAMLHGEYNRIANLSEIEVALLSPDSVPFLSDDQFQHLTSAEQIQRVPPHAIGHLRDNQLSMLSNEQVISIRDLTLLHKLSFPQINDVHESMLSHLKEDQKQLITSPRLLLKWDEPSHLSPEQCQLITAHLDQQAHEEMLKPWHIAFLSDVSKLTRKELIQAIPPEKGEQVTLQQATCLTAAQADLIRRLPPRHRLEVQEFHFFNTDERNELKQEARRLDRVKDKELVDRLPEFLSVEVPGQPPGNVDARKENEELQPQIQQPRQQVSQREEMPPLGAPDFPVPNDAPSIEQLQSREAIRDRLQELINQGDTSQISRVTAAQLNQLDEDHDKMLLQQVVPYLSNSFSYNQLRDPIAQQVFSNVTRAQLQQIPRSQRSLLPNSLLSKLFGDPPGGRSRLQAMGYAISLLFLPFLTLVFAPFRLLGALFTRKPMKTAFAEVFWHGPARWASGCLNWISYAEARRAECRHWNRLSG